MGDFEHTNLVDRILPPGTFSILFGQMTIVGTPALGPFYLLSGQFRTRSTRAEWMLIPKYNPLARAAFPILPRYLFWAPY